MSNHHPGKTKTALRQILSMMALAFGAMLPFIIAWVLIASTNDDNPLENVPDYAAPLQETVALTGQQFMAARTAYEYHDTVRLIIEGTVTLASGALSDGVFTFSDASGTALESPSPNDWTITIAGNALNTALDPEGPLTYDSDHVYTGLYTVGEAWQRLTFDTTLEEPSGGDLRITVIQVE